MKTLNKLLQVSVVSVVFFITSLLILVFVGSQLFSLLQLSLVAKEVRADWYEINTLSNDLMYMRIDSIDRLETTEEKLRDKIASFENDFRSLEKNNYVRSLSEETRDELVHARCIWNFSRQRLEKALLFIDLAIIGNMDFQEQIYKSDTKTVLETLILFWNSPNLTYQEKFPYRQLKANISVFDYIADEFSQIIDMADQEILPLVKKQITFWILLIFLIFAGAASYLYISLVKTLQPFQRLTKKIASIGSTDIQIFQPDLLSAKEKEGEEGDEVAIIGMGVQRLTSRIHSLYQQVISTETEKRDSQLKALQYQINPHFIYNTLGAIQIMATLNHQKEIGDCVYSLTRILRETLVNTKQLIPLSKEIQILSYYIDIMQTRYKKRLAVTFEIDNGFDDFLVPCQILQPIVENSIMHGLSYKLNLDQGDPQLKIEVKGHQKGMVIRIYDNGIGMDPYRTLLVSETEKNAENGQKTQSFQIGLNNIERRVKLFFGDSYGLEIQSEQNDYTAISIVLPCTKEVPHAQSLVR